MMLCRACGAELILTNVVPEVLPGFEHHTFVCSECQITERRITIVRHGREDESGSMSLDAKPTCDAKSALHFFSITHTNGCWFLRARSKTSITLVSATS